MKTYREIGRKSVTYAVMASLVLGQAAQVAQAASTDISDVPMAVKNLSPANIMFMLDNSGSMTNIVTDAPYTVGAGGSCGAATIIADGAAAPAIPIQTASIDLRVTSAGVQQIRRNSIGTTGPSNLTLGTSETWGTTAGRFCFDPNLRYNARLNGDTTCGTDRCPSGYLDAVFTGDYLNWYFSNGGANFGTAAPLGRKPGTVTRLEITKQATNAVLDAFNNNANVRPRVGLATYNTTTSGNGGTLLQLIEDMTCTPAPCIPAKLTSMKASVSALTAFGNTPIGETLSDIGRYFATGAPAAGLKIPPSAASATTLVDIFETGSGRSPAALTNPNSLSIVAPIQNFCQRSFAVLMTDGQPQGDQNMSTVLRNYKGDCPVPDPGRTNRTATTALGSAILSGMSAANITATAIGEYVSGPGMPSSGAKVVAKDPTLATVTLSAGATATAAGVALSFSTSPCIVGTPGGGTDNFGRKSGRFYESAGSDYLDDVAKALFEVDLRPDLLPPTTTPITPKSKPNNLITYTIAFGDVQLIEDPGLMLDTATGAGGLFFTANNSTELVAAFEKSADDILSKDGSAAAVAVANANVIAGDNASYASSYNSGTWTGDLISYPVDLTNGTTDVQSPIWVTGCPSPNDLVDPSDAAKGKKGCSAQVQLDLRAPSSRKIFSYTGTTGAGQGIQFQPTSATTTTKLSPTQQNLLNSTTTPPGTSDGAAVLSFLRGDRSGETANYRLRTHVMADIINSEPVVVREPFFNYGDTGYSAFKSSNNLPTARTRIVIQAVNDGKVHAFNTLTGVEEWAYVPNLVLPDLNNLSKRSGFLHKYSIDGTPVTGDVDFAKTDGAPGSPSTNWKTIVVGGLGKGGGRGYYALDVTATTAVDEATASNKALWEFPNSATSATDRQNLGFTFGRPIIVKTASRGWVVLVTSGYNNGTDPGGSGGDGNGYLFVLNARTGDVIERIGTTTPSPPTPAGTAASPNGLAHIAGYVESSDTDNTVTHVYGGDLKGNVWRFDLTGNPSAWNVKKLATLVDSSGVAQAVTTEPELAKVDTGSGVKRFVYVGTGRYLGDSDVATTQTQTMYGLIDDLSSSPLISPLRSSLQQQTLTAPTLNTDGTVTRTASSNTINFSSKKGWFVDMTEPGERINTNPALAVGALVFTSNIPSSTVCVPGGSSFFNVLDYKTGGFLTGSTVAWSSQSLGGALASRVVLIKLPSGAIKALARKSDATTVAQTVPVPATSSGVRRKSWREILQ